jgi:excinuclease ABC subunit C
VSAPSAPLAERVEGLPAEPGVYLFKNARGKVLYVGKAQNLRTRVRSYFSRGGDGRVQVPKLVERTSDVDVLVVPTVKDALLLENELIKQHKPPFNVRLRDDKQYLVLRLDPREEWPRLTMHRRFGSDGAQYFGPYTSSSGMRESISHLRRIFPLRSCTDSVFKDYARRGRPCIEFEMKRCTGPCCGRVEPAGYAELVEGTALFLRGRSQELVVSLQEQMRAAANAEHFEDAARLRDRIAAVEHTVERQQIVSERAVNRDVFGLARRGGEALVQALLVRDGRVVANAEYAFSEVELDDGELLTSFLGQYYAGGEDRELPAEVLTQIGLRDEGALEALLGERAGRRVPVRVPQRGGGRKLLEIATTNATREIERRVLARESLQEALAELQEGLGLRELPRRIECYDVSNLGGTLAVASRVVFEDGQPAKNDYRRYRMRFAEAGDDYGCLREVLGRRLEKRDSEPLPDLLMVDGGRGQLGVASVLLKDCGLELAHLGIAKERDAESPSQRVRRGGGLKAERLFLPNRVDPLLLPPRSQGLLLLQRVRDEAHRFAIEYQRTLRRKVSLTSILEELPGIGPGKRRALLRELGSLRGIRGASLETLAGVSGVSMRDAETLRRFFDLVEAQEPGGSALPNRSASTDAGEERGT